LSGGVSVLRRTIPMDERLQTYVTALMGALGWHGVAMIEFKYDAATDAFTLMEINGRFQASTALAIDAGVNLPWLLACLYEGRPLPAQAPYAVGVRERWLEGDLLALRAAIENRGRGDSVALPTVLLDFVRSFAPSVRYDEFRWSDWKPGVIEGWNLLRLVGGWSRDVLTSALRGERRA
jgi:predicted ATP-grasp superfamily ATP-dependent carboligase